MGVISKAKMLSLSLMACHSPSPRWTFPPLSLRLPRIKEGQCETQNSAPNQMGLLWMIKDGRARKSGFQLFSKLLPQEKTLLASVVTIGTQKRITNNCCKTGSLPGASLCLWSLESHCKLPLHPWDGV